MNKRVKANRISDPITMEVYSNRLMSIVEGMLNILVRSSFSTNVKERRDCSVGMFDATGRVLAQTDHTPLHLGSTLGAVTQLLEDYSIADMAEGDAFICNDPYEAGGTHLPDITIVSPVFHDGEVVLFLANIAHHSDVGGKVPGSISGSAQSIFEEGIRIPVVRIRTRGVVNDDMLKLIVLNTRDPKERELDLGVQLATNDRGTTMARELIAHMGAEKLACATEDLLAYTRNRFVEELKSLATFPASFTAYLDDDGVGDDALEITVRAFKRENQLVLDFGGTGPQAAGAMNVPFSALQATVCYAVKMMLDPGLMPNHGILDCIKVHVPKGTIVSPIHPAAVGARSISANKIARAIIGALAQLLPEHRGIASGQDIVPGICFSGQRVRGTGSYVYLETVGGGSGGLASIDGMDGVQLHVTNTSNLPVEALEHEYSLLVDEYALVEDSCGSGQHRGGLGLARQIAATEDDVVFSVRSDGHVYPAPGIRGGGEGSTAHLVFNPGTAEERPLHSKTASLVLNAGDSVRIETPGGGGFGPAAKRADGLILADIQSGKTSLAWAKRAYGAARVDKIVNSADTA